MRLPVETANLRRRANLDWVRQLSRLILAQPEFVGDGFNIVKEKQDEIRVELRSRAGFLHVKAYDMAEGDTILSVLGKTSRGTSIKRQIPLDDKAVASLSKILASINPFAFRTANFDAHEIGQPVPGPIETLDSDEPWMDDHFTQENFEQLQDAQIDGELGPALDLTRQAMLKKWKFARFAEGDTAGFEKWLKTQPKSVQDDWESNKEKYGDQFSKKARFAEGDTAGFEKWLKTQPKSVQDDWESNKEKYGDQFSKKAHRRNASGIDSNPYLDHKVKAAIMAFEEALDELMRKEETLCRVASSSLNEIGYRLLEERKKFMMEGNHRDDFSNTTKGFLISEVSEYLEGITEACNSMSGSRFQRLISMAFSINSKA